MAAAASLLTVLPAGPANSAANPGLVALNRLPVRAEASGVGYARSAFGQAWKDTDHNGCGQRDDVLARDLTQVTKRTRCIVVSGQLIDPYTGRVVFFTKAKANQVQVDHIVALAEAWRSGASRWTPSRREFFANDLEVLTATYGPVNQAKSDKDATEWTPTSTARRCWYARRVVAIKTHYGLSVDQSEKTKLAAFLRGC